ncbi:sulfatase [Halobacteriales archaeon QH_10_67_22]|nr:MAG: sulfatase [Halobacteriales archaeon QH_10_67_22]
MSDTDGPANVLFVVMDTVRKRNLSVYGYDRETTPTLEAFAEEATVFEEAVAPAPWTLPVHASMFTGLYPSQHEATQENPYLEGATTLAESLSAADYATACYSSNAWITPYTNLTDGFDDQDNFFQVMPGDVLSGTLARVWKKMNDSPTLRKVADRLVELGNTAHEYFAKEGGGDSKTPAIVERVQSFVADAEREDREWFTFVNLMDAHLPYHPPEAFAEEFAPGVDSTAVCQNSKEFNSGARDIDDEEWDAIRSLYDAEIAHIDHHLGRLFDWLRETDRWADTLVVVCADHGELHGEHDLYGHEFCIYDPLVNVPLLVKAPGLPAERDAETQVELGDLYHTVLDYAGVEAAEGGEPLDRARSLLSADYREFAAVDGAGRTRFSAHDDGDLDDYAFVDYHRPVVELRQLESKASAAGITLDTDSRFYSRMRAARRPDAKYIRNERIPDEAYRLDSDPGETENLAGGTDADDSPTAIEETEAALATFEAEVDGEWDGVTDEDVLKDMDEEARDRLQDLGYIE